MKGTPSVMTPDTLSGWTAATRYAGIAPKSFPTIKAWYQKIQVVGDALLNHSFILKVEIRNGKQTLP